MFIEERHKKILEMLQKNKSITNQEIQDMFGISYDSAKRDLRLLEEQGMLKRTHGGAILRETIGAQYNIGDLTAKERVAKVDPNYLAIAKKAVTCINDNDVIFITGASIGYLMTQNLPHDLNCTIVTNSISIADNLRQYLASAEKVYGLYPAGKIGTDSIISICPINALDVLITDDDALEEDLKAIEENGVEILLTV